MIKKEKEAKKTEARMYKKEDKLVLKVSALKSKTKVVTVLSVTESEVVVLSCLSEPTVYSREYLEMMLVKKL